MQGISWFLLGFLMFKFLYSMYLKAVIGPASKFHNTSLLIEWKIFHIHLTGGMIDGWGLPFHITGVEEGRLCCQCYLKITISTEKIGHNQPLAINNKPTYCKGQCQVSRCGQMEHEACSPRHTPRGSTAACSPSRTAPPTGWSS